MTALSKHPDEILMTSLANGNKKAASELYHRYSKSIYGYFIRMTQDLELAQDLTQNVFLKIIQFSYNWEETKTFRFWIFRIARNVLIDYHRAEQKFFKTESEEGIQEWDFNISNQENYKKEQTDMLLDAMTKLPAVMRELIELNRFQGFSYKEIAQMTVSNENAIRVKTFRALSKLKEIITLNKEL